MVRLENRLKKYLLEKMRGKWDVQSHEDKHTEGIPDLSYGAGGVNGWIELKQCPEWPTKYETPVKYSHFTAAQVNWLRRREKKGGHCFVFCKVAGVYFLFGALDARALRKGFVIEDYFRECLIWWRTLDPDELLFHLTEKK